MYENPNGYKITMRNAGYILMEKVLKSRGFSMESCAMICTNDGKPVIRYDPMHYKNILFLRKTFKEGGGVLKLIVLSVKES